MDQLERVEAVTRMQNYIVEHIKEPITLYDLSRSAGYSPFHSAHLFKELVGKSPFDYIRALRLSQAAMLLRDQGPKVIDVAFDFVFDSPEGFTRAFSREFGVTPHKYSKNPSPVYLFKHYPLRDAFLHYQKLKEKQKGVYSMEGNKTVQTVFVQVVDRPRRKLLLKRAKDADDYFAYCEEVGCDVWGLLCSVKEALYEPIGMWMPDSYRTPGTSPYAQGVEVPHDYAGTVPEGFELIDLPECKMMVFQGQPFENENFGEAIAIIWDVLKDYKPELYGFCWADEDAPRFQLEPQGFRGYIEARPVRPLNG